MIAESTRVSCSKCQQSFAPHCSEVIDAEADYMLVDALIDGSLFSTRCPHCQSNLVLDVPVLAYFPNRALPIWFLPAQGRDNEQNTVDFHRLLCAFKVSHPDDWDEAWEQLFWMIGRGDFSQVGLYRRSFPPLAVCCF